MVSHNYLITFVTPGRSDTPWRNDGTKSVWTTIFEEKKIRIKKGKKYFLMSLVANTDRPIISKSNWIEENLNDANCSFKNKKNEVSQFNQSRYPSRKTITI